MKGRIASVTVVGFVKATIFGLTYLMVSNILEKITIFDLLAYRFLTAALAFVLFRFLGLIKIDLAGKRIWSLAGIALLQPIGYYLFETIGISKTGSLMSGIVVSMTPIVTMVLEAVILKEQANRKQKLFIILSTAGVVLITVCAQNGGGDSSLAGILFILLAVLCEGFFVVFTRKSSERFTPMEITYVMMLTSAVVFNGINAVRRAAAGELANYFAPLLELEVFWSIMYLGVLASSVAYLLYSFMLSKTKASSTAVFAGVITIVSIIAGIVFRDEAFFWYHAVGTVMILAGVWGVSRFKSEDCDLKIRAGGGRQHEGA